MYQSSVILFSGPAECNMSENNLRPPNPTRPIKPEMNYS